MVRGDGAPNSPVRAWRRGVRVALDVSARSALLPGFTDAHVHPVQGGLERLACDLSGCPADSAAYLRHIGDYTRAHPHLDWIQGGGWAMAAFPGGLPTARELDGVVPDRPVALANRDHHGMWVNTRALEAAGITASTPELPGGDGRSTAPATGPRARRPGSDGGVGAARPRAATVDDEARCSAGLPRGSAT